MASRVIVNTGEGKGKTTAAMGVVMRAVGHGHKVAVFQFMKGSLPTGESDILEKKLKVELHRLGSGFSWTKESWDEDRAMAQEGWDKARQALMSGFFDLVVLDEINYVIGYGLLDPEQVARSIAERPAKTSVILTGRGTAPEIAAVADTITDMRPEKHAFENGVKATKGIEF